MKAVLSALVLGISVLASADTGGPAIVFVRRAFDVSSGIKNIIVRRIDPVTMLPSEAQPLPRLERMPFDWDLKGTGDFDGDGNRDLLMQKPNGRFIVRFYDGSMNLLSEQPIAYNLKSTQKFGGIGDMNKDGKDDIFFTDTADGLKLVKAWLMNGVTVMKRIPVASLNPLYVLAGVGDFDGDGVVDLLEKKNPTSQTAVGPAIQFLHYNAGTEEITKGDFVKTENADQWFIAGVGDFNDDGKADILLINADTNTNHRRRMQVRLMDGATITAYVYTPPCPKVWTVNGARF